MTSLGSTITPLACLFSGETPLARSEYIQSRRTLPPEILPPGPNAGILGRSSPNEPEACGDRALEPRRLCADRMNELESRRVEADPLERVAAAAEPEVADNRMPELRLQASRRGGRLREGEEAGGLPVEPVDDEETARRALGGDVIEEQPVGRASALGLGPDREQPRRLVDHQQICVLVHEAKRPGELGRR